jgi:20S proteasome subunit beta 3
MKPSTFAHFVSSLLYEKRCGRHETGSLAVRASTLQPRLTRACISSFGPWFCEPVIAGLEPDGTPFVTGMDLLGALCVSLPLLRVTCASN